MKNPPGYLRVKQPQEKKLLIGGWLFWPVAFAPWLIGVLFILKATITALV
jgi:hypothetical protein